MGRIVLFISLLAIPLLGFGVAASAESGGYYVNCQNSGSGFQVTFTNAHTGSTSTVSSPAGACLFR